MHSITTSKTLKLPLYNQGTNEMNIKFAKEMLIMNAVRSLTNVIEVKKEYPVDNVIEIDLSLDVVLLSKDEYKRLIRDSHVKF